MNHFLNIYFLKFSKRRTKSLYPEKHCLFGKKVHTHIYIYSKLYIYAYSKLYIYVYLELNINSIYINLYIMYIGNYINSELYIYI